MPLENCCFLIKHNVVNYSIVYFYLFIYLFFLSFIAKGLAICRLGGMITTQNVLFDSL